MDAVSVSYYRTLDDRQPYKQWFDSITDETTGSVIDARVARFRGGNFSNSRSIGGGAIESKINFGPGYRIYYGRDGDKVVLLCGGDKSTQDRDIALAKKHWKDYKRRIKRYRELAAQEKKK